MPNTKSILGNIGKKPAPMTGMGRTQPRPSTAGQSKKSPRASAMMARLKRPPMKATGY